MISEKDRCKKCEGKKVVKEVKILEVHVDKGMKHGQKITFGGEADQAPGVEPGDIVLVLQGKEHEVCQCSLSSLEMMIAMFSLSRNSQDEVNKFFVHIFYLSLKLADVSIYTFILSKSKSETLTFIFIFNLHFVLLL